MNLRKGVFERRVLTRSGLFACLGNGFGQIYWKIVSIRVRTLSNTHFISVKTYQKERFLTSGLTFVAEKRLFLNSVIVVRTERLYDIFESTKKMIFDFTLSISFLVQASNYE